MCSPGNPPVWPSRDEPDATTSDDEVILVATETFSNHARPARCRCCTGSRVDRNHGAPVLSRIRLLLAMGPGYRHEADPRQARPGSSERYLQYPDRGEFRRVPGPRTLDREAGGYRSEEHTSELQSRFDLVCRLLLEKKKYRVQLACR